MTTKKRFNFDRPKLIGEKIAHNSTARPAFFGSTAICEMSQNLPETFIIQEGECAYCEQWGENNSTCKHCGAPTGE